MSTTTLKQNEKKFKNEVAGVLTALHGFHVTFHEDMYQIGIPDASYGARDINGWIEFKWDRIKFQPGQAKWLSHRAMAGGHCFVLCGKEDGAILIDWGQLLQFEYQGPIAHWHHLLADQLCAPAECQSLPDSMFQIKSRADLRQFLRPGSSPIGSDPDKTVP